MKTFNEWWDIFRNRNIIGIDEDIINYDYNSLTNEQIRRLVGRNNYTEVIDKAFRQFCLWMQKGDIVMVGIGQTTRFNIAGIFVVTGDYIFQEGPNPRHIRKIKSIKMFPTPRPLQRFGRASRLELIDESDFIESVIDLIT
ncbi:MAG: hypothetical protein AB1599_00920 [Planctomycetota bacterium]